MKKNPVRIVKFHLNVFFLIQNKKYYVTFRRLLKLNKSRNIVNRYIQNENESKSSHSVLSLFVWVFFYTDFNIASDWLLSLNFPCKALFHNYVYDVFYVLKSLFDSECYKQYHLHTCFVKQYKTFNKRDINVFWDLGCGQW